MSNYNIDDIYRWICDAEEYLRENEGGLGTYRLGQDKFGNDWMLAICYDYDYIEDARLDGEIIEGDVFSIKLGLAPKNRMLLDYYDVDFPIYNPKSKYPEDDDTEIQISSQPKEGCISDIKYLLDVFENYKNNSYYFQDEYDDEYYLD